MSDGQYLGFMFGKDLVTKAAMIYQMKKAFGFTIEMMEKQFKAERAHEQSAQNYEEPKQQQRQRPQPAPQAQAQEEYIPTVQTEEVSVEEIAAMKKSRKSPGRPKKDASVQSMKIDYPNRVKTDPIPKEVRDGM
jgi:hypothetical protein